jgi:hypothetical protein
VDKRLLLKRMLRETGCNDTNRDLRIGFRGGRLGTVMNVWTLLKTARFLICRRPTECSSKVICY